MAITDPENLSRSVFEAVEEVNIYKGSRWMVYNGMPYFSRGGKQ